MSDDTSERLIRQILTGDEAACTRLVERYGRIIFAHLMRQVHEADDADDLSQEVFLTVFSRLDQLRQPERLRSWLLTIADNTVRKWRRRRMAQARIDGLWHEIQAQAGSDDESFLSERRHLVRQALQRLSDTHREVVTHHYFKGYSYQDTAIRLGLDVEAVRNRLYKARRRLKQEIDRMNGTASPRTIALNQEDMTMLRSAGRFVSRDASRPGLNGIYCDHGGRVVATDGHRLFLWTSERLTALPGPLLLGPWHEIDIPAADRGAFALDGDNFTLCAPGVPDQAVHIIVERFPDYTRVIPSEWPINVYIDTADLRSIAHRIEGQLQAQHPTPEGTPWTYTPTVEIRISATEQTLSLVVTRDMGYSHPDGEKVHHFPYDPVGDWTFRVSIPARCEGMSEADRFRIWVDHRYLLEAVEALEAGGVSSIRARFIAPNAHMIFGSSDREDRFVLQMPMRMAPDA